MMIVFFCCFGYAIAAVCLDGDVRFDVAVLWSRLDKLRPANVDSCILAVHCVTAVKPSLNNGIR
jgi:hypothetical protein